MIKDNLEMKDISKTEDMDVVPIENQQDVRRIRDK